MILGALIFFIILVGKAMIMPEKVMFSIDDTNRIDKVIQELEDQEIPHRIKIEIDPEYRDEVKMIIEK
jgi:hypothetical protein